ncbi:MAG: PD40 domain-containing protein [Candidatus Marinimicrobia bacterium]|nr:PD40 domain-containing protein [Candidatus Neomarinimicrobiota bacterium]
MRNNIKLLICISISLSVSCEMKKSNSSYLFDLPEPTLKPAIFAAQQISTTAANERDICISGDGNEIYFSRGGKIMVITRQNGVWATAEVATFSGEYPEFEAQLTLVGHAIYYISRRPLSGTGEPENWQIWYSERQDTNWSEPRRLNNEMDFYPTFTASGYMYFTDAQNDIYRTVFSSGQMGAREKLPEVINTDQAEYNAFIAPDGSYLIYSSHNRLGELGGGDLYINFRNADGSWGIARHMGPGINSPALDYCPYVSPDGKYFFFSSRRGGDEDIYWVDAKIIDHLRMVNLDCITGIMTELDSNGFDQAIAYYRQYINDYSDYADYDGSVLQAVKNRLLAQGLIETACEMISFYSKEYPNYQPLITDLEYSVLSSDVIQFTKTNAELTAQQDSLPDNFEQQINLLGYHYLRIQLLPQATAIFKLNTQLFPESFNVFDSYAEILLARGDTSAAIINYEKSLDLNAQNDNARTILTKLVK